MACNYTCAGIDELAYIMTPLGLGKGVSWFPSVDMEGGSVEDEDP